jgi:hypothetical protein
VNRTALHRASALKRHKRLKPVSDKRRDEREAWAECVRVVHERSQGRCEALPLWPHRCEGPKHLHHVATRKRRPDLRNDPANILDLCRLAHDFAHANNDAAEALGLLEPSGPCLKSRLFTEMEDR